MDDLLLNRLERAVESLLEKNRQLQQECTSLKREKAGLEQERCHLLSEVERILERIDSLPMEDS